MSVRDFDALIVGGGVNGLVAATMMARAGCSVGLIEQHRDFGGMAGLADASASGAFDFGLLRPVVSEALGLSDGDLGLVDLPLTTIGTRDGETVALSSDPEETSASLEHLSSKDSEQWPRFLAALAAASQSLEPFLQTDPSLGRMARLYTDGHLVRWMTRSVAETLDEWFESEGLKAGLASIALHGQSRGPMAAGTGFGLLYQLAGTRPDRLRPLRLPNAGAGPLAAMEKAARLAGVELFSATRVRSIVVRGGAVAGASVVSNEREGSKARRLNARVLLSSLDAKATLLGLVGPDQLELRAVRRVRHWRGRGAWIRLELAQTSGSSQREATGAPGREIWADSLQDLERSADAAARGKVSARPLVETLKGLGKSSTVELRSAFCPVGLTSDDRTGFVDNAVAVAGRRSDEVVGATFAEDWESRFGATEGSLHHGEMTLDQSFVLRGAPGCTGPLTPIEGLFLCGAGAHPGGGATGLPGRSAALAALRCLES